MAKHHRNERVEKRWQAEIYHLESRLMKERENLINKVEILKDNVKQKLCFFKEQLAYKEELTKKAKEHLKKKIENAQIQLALGELESLEMVKAQKKQIQKIVRSLKKGFDKKLAKTADIFQLEILAILDTLETLDIELDAIEAYYQAVEARNESNFYNKKRKCETKILQFDKAYKQKRAQSFKRLSRFNKELSLGLKTIKKAYANLKK